MANTSKRPSDRTIRQQLVVPLILIVILQGLAILTALFWVYEFRQLDMAAIRIILAASVISLILGLIIAAVIANSFSHPIIRLARQVRELDPNCPFRLARSRIRELNELTDSLEQMSADIAASAARLSSTIDLVGLHLASFEENTDKGNVRVSASFFDLTGLTPAEPGSRLLRTGQWQSFEDNLLSRRDPAYPDVYVWQPEGSVKKRWLRLRTAGEPSRRSGILMDVTDEILRHRRLELERDYDALTHLLNKPAFLDQCAQTMEQMAGSGIAAMLFSDLDNLKEINDRYGHKFGDRYIQMAAGVFGQFRRFQGLAARLSGDEFAVFLVGRDEYADREGLRILISQILNENRQQLLAVPDEKQIPLSMSVGLAWYPSDSAQVGELLNLADFAMYQIKKEGKAGLHEFLAEEYQQNQELMESRANLDQLLVLKQLECVAQPVVDAHTAEIAGYAMTMRPLHSRIRLPLEVIELARQQNRLPELERLMFNLCAHWAGQNASGSSALKIFFCALAGLTGVTAGIPPAETELAPLHGRLVVDMNGSEMQNERSIQQFVQFVAALEGELVISQFSSGSLENPAGDIRPDYIKLDQTIIRDIDKDAARQQLLAKHMAWCASQGIQVIAEGIETEAEMVTAIRLGADYLQGYFFGRPQAETTELPLTVRLQILSARRLS